MADIKALRKRVATVRSTQQITKAMKMVAAAKLRRSQEAVEHARPYAERIERLLGTLATNEEASRHPLIAQREEKRIHLVLITGDRGLCGAYNSSLVRRADAFLAAHPGATLTVAGRRGAEYFRRRHVEVEEQLPGPVGAPIVETASALATALATRVLDGKTDAVYVICSEFHSVLSQVPTTTRLIPVALAEGDDAEGATRPDYLYEPSGAAVLADLVPRYVTAQVTRAFLEAVASEHGARMTAMDSATRNASELIDRLTLEMNRARQATITKELMEIVGGAEALKG
jgi:F-type H+-transporting ATPase subunit gamma